MKLFLSAAIVALITATSGVAQPSGVAPGSSSRAAQDQAENRITAQLNEQQLANLKSATNQSQSIPQTATRPNDCSPSEANCLSGGAAR